MLNQKIRKKMKKFSVICGLALAMLAAGCSKDATTDINPITKTTLSVSLDQTRTYLGEAVDGVAPILWSEGDAVAINGVSTAIAAEYVGQPAAAFTGVVAADDYSVFYPASLLDANSVGKNVYTIPTVQQFVEGSFAPNTSILVGYAEHNDVKTSVALKNVYGYLKITLTNAANVKKVYVSATADEAISGTFEIDYKTAAITPLAGQSIIRVMGVQATAGVATVVVAVPAGEYAEGFTVKAIDSSNKAMVKTIGKTAGVEIERAQLYTLATLAYVASADPEVEITTAEELDSFLMGIESEDYAQWVNAKGEVVLGNDIDLADYELTATTVPFTGVFNGQGYALKNWSFSAPLFGEVGETGTVKNLVIDESCMNAYDSNALNKDIAIVVGYNHGVLSGIENNAHLFFEVPTATAHIYVGAIAARATGGKSLFVNCVNNGNVGVSQIKTVYIADGETENSWYQVHIGGLCGRLNRAEGATNSFENCINNGNVTVEFDDKGSNSSFGGILGSTSNQGTAKTETEPAIAPAAIYYGAMKNCINNGDVTVVRNGQGSGAYSNIGGVVGYYEGEVIGCTNYGKVEYVTEKDTAVSGCTGSHIGGVAGVIVWKAQDCANYGAVEADFSLSNAGGIWTDQLSGPHVGNAVGGVVGFCGIPDRTELVMTGCNNWGNVTVDANTMTTHQSHLYAGGVVGAPLGHITSCSNYGEVDITHLVYSSWLGGVVGRSLVAVANDHLYNYGKVNVVANRTGLTHQDGEAYVGGVLGRSNGDISYCETGVDATMTVSGDGKFYVAAISGYGQGIDYCIQRNDVTFTGISGMGEFKYGGMAGQVLTGKVITNSSVTSDALITLSPAGTAVSYIGGLGGYVNTSVTDSHFAGDLIVTSTSTGKHYIGGIAAYAKAEVSGCETTTDASMNLSLAKCQSYIAGIVSYFSSSTAPKSISTCDNNCPITINTHTTNANSYMGGIVGQSASGLTMDTCNNYAALTVKSASGFCLGGLAGCAAGTVTNSSNTGKLDGSAMADLAGNSAVGGLNGFGQANLTGCTNSGAVIGNTLAPAGGLVGKHGNTNQKYNNCTIEGSVTATVAGIVCGHNNATSASVSATIGDSQACKVKRSFTLNGASISESDLTDITKLWGQITTEGKGVIGEFGLVLID